MDYSPVVRQHFRCSGACAGDETTDWTAVAEAEDRSLNVWVRFAVVVTDGKLVRVAYNVFGCPHFLAACEWVAAWLTDREYASMRALPLDRMVDELVVPREKFGKLLRIEDALLACADEVATMAGTQGGE